MGRFLCYQLPTWATNRSSILARFTMAVGLTLALILGLRPGRNRLTGGICSGSGVIVETQRTNALACSSLLVWLLVRSQRCSLFR